MKQTVKKDDCQGLPQREPIILNSEDWTREEWAVLCKLSGLPASRTERIVLHVSEIESYEKSGKMPIRAGLSHGPAAEVTIVVRDGQVSEVYAEGGAVHVNVLDLDTDEPCREESLQRTYALLQKKAASGEIIDIL